MHKLHLLSLVFISILITACASTPYTRLKTPAISGTISINNQAAQGLPVYLSIKGDDSQCFKIATEVVTGPDGEFHIKTIKEQLPHAPIMKYYLDEWNICTQYKDQRINLYSGNRYGTGSVNASLNLRCELSKSTLDDYCSAR
ncbi:MAG: hypothetical protein OEY87_03175 [Gammaproteobacteria bacterium]|nr:hypothetical protein [Gammaproteobacteria bacterium]MDH5735103.1 hypothetical protein [Gammaproteobacteria bacterium]